MHLLITIAALALSISAVSFTIARTKVSEPFRVWMKRKSSWFGNLFNCPYCVSHWLSFGAVAIYQPRVIEKYYPLDLLVTAFVIVALSAWSVGIISRAIKPGQQQPIVVNNFLNPPVDTPPNPEVKS